ncbi:ribosomal protein S18-alanine N-acetyltransferase [Tumebacillus flagellatus]|uniref:Alanine acetyltransferase n=1 Tax=Tumebacillus flagellatus TaxID=1157490 RepID=A0A074LNY7_9BACL|nr:ribosomal protein S18-alanine N-acetyltransferase [Tumebacillus flagellatus]KEO82205.1 alanine acetyltransferase [Tumebacillus flagellatus]
MTGTLEFRRMTLEDIPSILEIEHKSFTLPWSEEAFRLELTQNHFAKYVVAVVDDLVVGYGGTWVIIDEAHVTNVAVHPDYRGHGIGELLMRQLMAVAISHGADRMTLEVRVSNLVAQNLYEKMGFLSHGIRKGYYTDNNEDAMIMWAELPRLALDPASDVEME